MSYRIVMAAHRTARYLSDMYRWPITQMGVEGALFPTFVQAPILPNGTMSTCLILTTTSADGSAMVNILLISRGAVDHAQ